MALYDSSSDYLENKILNWIFRSGSPPMYGTTSASSYMALFSSDPTDAYITSTELSGSGYARVRIPPASWTVSNGIAYLGTGVYFPVATGSWGWIPYLAIMNELTGGSILFNSPIVTLSSTPGFSGIYCSEGQLFSVYGNGACWITGQPGYCQGLNNSLLNNILRKEGTNLINLDLYIALYTTMPDYNDFGGVEVPSLRTANIETGYSRIPIGGTSMWNQPVAGSIVNQKEIILINNAAIDIGQIKGMGLRTSPESRATIIGADTLLLLWEFNPWVTILQGDGFGFDISDLRIVTY